MRILISNDDGIYSPGIMALYQAVRDLGQVTIVAPLSEKSGTSHAITIADPIKIKTVKRENEFVGHGASGTPVDCVKLATTVILDQPPDLVLSGINLGANTGASVIYSGTVSAATEGAIMGIPSLAISLATFTNPHWDAAMLVAKRLTQEIKKRGLPDGTFLNVNIPNLPPDAIKGFAVTRVGRSRFAESFHQSEVPQRGTYYWLDGGLKPIGCIENTDLQALEQGFVSVTPIDLDRTHHSFLPTLKGWQLSL